MTKAIDCYQKKRKVFSHVRVHMSNCVVLKNEMFDRIQLRLLLHTFCIQHQRDNCITYE